MKTTYSYQNQSPRTYFRAELENGSAPRGVYKLKEGWTSPDSRLEVYSGGAILFVSSSGQREKAEGVLNYGPFEYLGPIESVHVTVGAP